MDTVRDECDGRGILGTLEDLLDVQVQALMTDWQGAPPDDLDEAEQLGDLKGFSRGLATAIAVMTNPYYPDVNSIRAAAMARYEERKALEEQDEAPTDGPAADCGFPSHESAARS
jgi:hypothetical protein